MKTLYKDKNGHSYFKTKRGLENINPPTGRLPMDSEEIYHMPAEKNKKVWCVVAVVLFVVIVVTLIVIL